MGKLDCWTIQLHFPFILERRRCRDPFTRVSPDTPPLGCVQCFNGLCNSSSTSLRFILRQKLILHTASSICTGIALGLKLHTIEKLVPLLVSLRGLLKCSSTLVLKKNALRQDVPKTNQLRFGEDKSSPN